MIQIRECKQNQISLLTAGALIFTGLLAGCGVAGCGGGEPLPETESQPDEPLGTVDVSLPLDFSGIQITWEPCLLHDDPAPGMGDAECATVEMPLLWNADPRTLSVRVKRKLSNFQPAAAQLWFMAGGPGGSATRGQASLMEVFARDVPSGVDSYAVDHRGTGGSSLLECPGIHDAGSPGGGAFVTEELDACAAHLFDEHEYRLVGYAETFSAIDIMALVQAERRPEQPVFLTGGSGGTILGQRFLQLFPDGVDGVILNAINPADRSIVDWADAHNSAMKTLLDENCKNDPECGPRLNDAPFAAWEEMLEGLMGGACPGVTDVMTVEDVERLISNRLLWIESELFFVPSMIYRLQRCSPDDVTAFLTLAEGTGILNASTPPVRFSVPLLRYISFSEMIFTDRFQTIKSIEAYADGLRDFGKNLALDAADGRKKWLHISYEDPAYDNGWAVTDTPMLMLQGAVDPLTPATGARRVAANFSAPNQQYVEFRDASHNFVHGSTVVSGPAGPFDCRYALWVEFMEAGGAPIDTSCSTSTPAIDFTPPPDVVLPRTGTMDAWD